MSRLNSNVNVIENINMTWRVNDSEIRWHHRNQPIWIFGVILDSGYLDSWSSAKVWQENINSKNQARHMSFVCGVPC